MLFRSIRHHVAASLSVTTAAPAGGNKSRKNDYQKHPCQDSECDPHKTPPLNEFTSESIKGHVRQLPGKAWRYLHSCNSNLLETLTAKGKRGSNPIRLPPFICSNNGVTAWLWRRHRGTSLHLCRYKYHYYPTQILSVSSFRHRRRGR